MASPMDQLNSMLAQIQRHSASEVIEKARQQRKSKVRSEFVKTINSESVRLQTALDREQEQQRRLLAEAIAELGEAEAAFKAALGEGASVLASESAAVEAAWAEFEKVADRKATELQGVLAATQRQVADVSERRAGEGLEALAGAFGAAVEATKAQVAEMCLRVEEAADTLEASVGAFALLSGDSMSILGGAGTGGSQGAMLLDDDM